ncbi:hypothetical protein H4R19_004587 [Coemansia spiralis]|nr:hypothetical protein H4R19_004587 [Coemansia spiralis]
MKFAVASIVAFASLVLADFGINNPIGTTVWPANGTPVTISWISLDGAPLTGNAKVELMSGNNASLDLVLVVGTVPAANGKISFTPPPTLPKDSTYAVRVTVNGVPHYSHSFQAGSGAPAPKGSEASSSPVPSSAPASSSSAAPTSARPTSQASSSQHQSKDESTKELSDMSDESKESSSRTRPHSSSHESSESSESSDDLESSGASRSVVAAGLLGVVALAALF